MASAERALSLLFSCTLLEHHAARQAPATDFRQVCAGNVRLQRRLNVCDVQVWPMIPGLWSW
jgi:hypothetical protein